MDLFFNRDAALGIGPAVDAVSEGVPSAGTVVVAAGPLPAALLVMPNPPPRVGAAELFAAPPRLGNSEVGAALGAAVDAVCNDAEAAAAFGAAPPSRLDIGSAEVGAAEVACALVAAGFANPPKRPPLGAAAGVAPKRDADGSAAGVADTLGVCDA